jgi:hypothetical protein
MKRESIVNISVFCLLVALGVASRWISDAYQPALSNMTAANAVALFAGFFFAWRLAACLVPLAIVVLSNLGLPKYNDKWEMGVAVAMLVLPIVLGWFLKRRPSVLKVLGFAATPAILFYLVTDCVYWPGFEMYPRTLAGQIDSYIAALPFLRNMLLGDLLFTGLVFGTYWLAVSSGLVLPKKRELAPALVVHG